MFCNVVTDYSNHKVLSTTLNEYENRIIIKNRLFPSKLTAITFFAMGDKKNIIKTSLNFKRTKTESTSRENFEADLSVLTDKYVEKDIDDRVVEKETNQQYKVYLKDLKESENNLSFCGTKWLLPFSTYTFTIENKPSDNNSISFQFVTYFGLIPSIGFNKIYNA